MALEVGVSAAVGAMRIKQKKRSLEESMKHYIATNGVSVEKARYKMRP